MIKAVIPAAGLGTRVSGISGDIPKAMLPVNGKPAIGYIIESLMLKGIRDFAIVIGHKGEQIQSYLNDRYDANIKFYEQKNLLGLAHAILQTEDFFSEDDSVLIHLGDTLADYVMIRNDFLVFDYKTDSRRWCIIEDEKLREKPPSFKGEKCKALIGAYFFKDSKKLFDALRFTVLNDLRIGSEYQLSTAVNHLIDEGSQFTEIFRTYHYDIGSIDNYHEARKALLRGRSFNTVTVQNGMLTKYSDNHKKIADEIKWYLTVPNELKQYAPQLFSWEMFPVPKYSVEYYGYKTLAELYLYDRLHIEIWDSVFQKLLELLMMFRQYRTLTDKVDDAINEAVIEKTLERMKKWPEEFHSSRTAHETFITQYKLKSVHSDSLMFVHGDLCFSNILYDLQTGIIKLLDPRGSFSSYSDAFIIEYEIAKLLHSLEGDYDIIKNDFKKKNKDQENITDLFIKKIIEVFGKEFLNTCRFIEYTLFLSMIPLHSDRPDHQRRFLLKAEELLEQL